METKIEKITDIKKEETVFRMAGEIIKDGGLVAFPTETVYGLGANGLDAAACAGIYAAKGRPSDNPLILHVADRAMIDMVAEEVSPLAEKLIAFFCPGPLTLIVRKKACVPDSVTGGLATVGVRMPDNDVARALIRAAGVPIAAPSANISGRPSPTTAGTVYEDMKGRIPLILDGGNCRFGVESTIVDATGDTAIILRPGAITPDMLGEVADEVSIDPAIIGADTIPKAPGMKYTHYAPKAPLTLISADDSNIAAAFAEEVNIKQNAGETVGVIVSEETAAFLKGKVPPELIAVYGKRYELNTIAAGLYESLRYFDNSRATMLFGEAVTEEGLGLAIMNRLKKAAGGRIIDFGKGIKKNY